jgi:hypothetical protein
MYKYLAVSLSKYNVPKQLAIKIKLQTTKEPPLATSLHE